MDATATRRAIAQHRTAANLEHDSKAASAGRWYRGLNFGDSRSELEGVANRFYGDVIEAVILHVDPARLAAEVRAEPPADGIEELFPHVYGPIPIEAVVTTTPWRRGDDGVWRVPERC